MKKFMKIFSIIMCILILIATSIFFIFVTQVKKLNISDLYNREAVIKTNSKVDVFDNENNQIENASLTAKVNIETLPTYIKDAFISIEDKNFYKHKGLNYKRIIKASINNLISRQFKEGASTISQQLIKNLMLSSEKTLNRKFKEIVLTKKLEKEFTKEEILEAYLNCIYFGNNAYGLESASFNYFNKPAKNLNLSEAATLAGIIKSPKNYSPTLNPDACKNRRNTVLKQMYLDNKISKDEYESNIVKPIELDNKILLNKNSFYLQGCIEEACKILNITEEQLIKNDYKLFTYLNNEYQEILNTNISNETFYHTNKFGNTADSCGVIIDSQTGGIEAFSAKSLYDVINMKRSPGSTIKPILVYAPALEKGTISPATQILDEKTDFNGYKPQNVADYYYGYVSASKAVAKSLNIPAIKILKNTGLNYCIDFAKNSNITFDEDDNNLSIALGALTNGTTVIQLTNSFIGFSNNGIFNEAKFIRKICDKSGNLLYEHKPLNKQVMSPATAYLMTDMLIDGVNNGTSKVLKSLNFQVAGKTGTVGIKNSNNNTDCYSLAYTTNKVGCIWFGNSTNKEEFILEGSNNGGTYCSRLLCKVFKEIYHDKKPQNFVMPDDVEEVAIDLIELKENHSIKRASVNSPEKDTILAKFNKKFSPTNISLNYEDIQNLKLSCKYLNNKCEIKFNAKKNYIYEIYRASDKYKKIATIKNDYGEITYLDLELEKNKIYKYFIKAIKQEENMMDTLINYNKNLIKSNEVIIYT